jgi:hypothetical protein
MFTVDELDLRGCQHHCTKGDRDRYLLLRSLPLPRRD